MKFIDYLQVALVIIIIVFGLIIYPMESVSDNEDGSVVTTSGTIGSSYNYYDVNNDPTYWWWLWQN